MTTINYTTDINPYTGIVTVEWAGLTAGDEGQAFDCRGLEFASVQYSGSFNGGNVSFRASNEITPTNFAEVLGGGSAGIQARIDGIPFMYLGAVKPVALTNIASINIAAIFKIAR